MTLVKGWVLDKKAETGETGWDWDPSKSQTSKRAAAADPQFVSREHVVVPVGRLSSRRRDRDLASRIGLAWSSAQLERRGLAAQAQAAASKLSAASMHFALACVGQSIAELGWIQSQGSLLISKLEFFIRWYFQKLGFL